MFNKAWRSLIFTIILTVFSVGIAGNAHAFGLSALALAASCDPEDVSVTGDVWDFTYHSTTNCNVGEHHSDPDSCKAQNIGIFEGNNPFSVNVHYSLGLGDPYESRGIDINTHGFIKGTSFEFRLEGDMGCVYAHPIGSPIMDWKVPPKCYYDDTKCAGKNIDWDRRHCVPVPVPNRSPVIPSNQFASIIAPACLGSFNPNDTYFRFDNGESRSFTGRVVMCVEGTMDNLFSADPAVLAGGDSMFTMMQDRMVGLVRALLVLYVVVIGYKIIMSGKLPGLYDGMWHAFRILLVLYFAVGPGMTDVLPAIKDLSKRMATIVLESSFGSRQPVGAAGTIITDLEDELEVLAIERDTERSEYKNLEDIPATPLAVLNTERQEFIDKKKEHDAKAIELAEKRVEFDGIGYRYCDFSGPSYAYAPGAEGMQLWDMLDCKFSKLLGVGDNEASRVQPQMLIFSVASIFTPQFLGGGIIVFLLMLIFFIFVILLLLRITMAMLMALLALTLLVYIAPLIIPAVLFEYTRKLFDGWLKAIVSYTVQPIFIFMFAAFLLSAFDMVFYGNNKEFIADNGKHSNKIVMTSSATAAIPNQRLNSSVKLDAFILANQNLDPGEGEVFAYAQEKLVCDDPNTIGCIYQKAIVRQIDIICGLKLYVLENVEMADVGTLIVDLFALLFIAGIGYTVLGTIEEISARMTNAVGGGISKLNPAPMLSPQKIGNATVGKAGQGASAAGKAKFNSMQKGRINSAQKKATTAKRGGINTGSGGKDSK